MELKSIKENLQKLPVQISNKGWNLGIQNWDERKEAITNSEMNKRFYFSFIF